MKKILLISVAFWGIPVMVQAEEPPCEQLDSSWCDDHGYKEEVCLSGYTCIKCPLNLSQVYNHRSQVKNCKVGDILWSDNNCYVLDITNGNITSAPEKMGEPLTPIGVVFDDVNKLAVGLTAMTGGTAGLQPPTGLLYHWQIGSSGLNFFPNIVLPGTSLEPNYLFFGEQGRDGNGGDAMYDSCSGVNGYVAAANYCSVDCSTENAGNYCNAEFDNDSSCNNVYLSCDNGSGQRCSRTQGCKIAGMGDPGNFRVPTEELISVGTGIVTGVIGFSAGPSGYATTSATRGGWSDTVRLRKGTTLGSGQLGFSAPAAMACDGLNTSFTSCPPNAVCANDTGGEVGAGHVWFLPSSGDLAKLVDNYTLVKDALTLAGGAVLYSGVSDYYWSSTQASQSGFYSYAYAVKLKEKSTTSTDSCGVTTTTTTYSSTMESKGRSAGNRVVCVYHYGDDWDMSSYAALWAGQTQGQQ